MNQSNGKGSIYSTSSSVSRKAGDFVPDQFPAGLRVLVVDDDPTCLMILEKMLRTCLYEVTKCNRAEIALSKLRENADGFDIVLSDVHMPDMDGFKLLEHIGLEMDLPVIMMSADDSKNVVMKGVTHGACDYLIKPVRIEALKNIWQHVVRKRKNEWKDYEQSGSVDECDQQQKQSEDADYSSSANEGNWKSSKKRKDDEDEADEREDTSTLKKPRVVWSVELHQQFVAAVNQLGIDKAVPKKILELMNVPGLTRENVASHLQKYRLYLRRLSGVSPQSNLNSSFINPQDATFGQFTSLNGLDLQTLAATGQLSPQSLATLQAAALGRSTAKSGIPMSIVDQRNLFSFENPKLRFGERQPQQLGSSKQMNLLHGIPTTIEPKPLRNFNHSSQSVGNINLQVSSHGGPSSQNNSLRMQMAQQQSRAQIISDGNSSQVARLPSSMGQTLLSTGITANVSVRSQIPENVSGHDYNQISVSSSLLNFPVNTQELPGNSFPLGSAPGISSLTSKAAFQPEVSSELNGLTHNYNIFNDLQRHKSQNWELQNVGLSFDASQHSNSLQVDHNLASSVLGHPGFSPGPMTVENRNFSSVGKGVFSSRDNTQHVNALNVGQHLNTLPLDDSIRVKTEAVGDVDPSNLFSEHFGQEDLMSALLKQQGGNGAAENEFDFDGYSIDNIPV